MIVDANVYLRYLLNDLQEQAEIAAEIIENESIFLPNEVFAKLFMFWKKFIAFLNLKFQKHYPLLSVFQT